MDKSLRTILWILVGLVVLSSFSTGWFFVAKERLYNDYINLDNLFRTNTERLNSELAFSNKEKKELKEKLEAVQGQSKLLEKKNTDLKSDYESTLSERNDLELELVRAKKGKIFLEKKLKEMEGDAYLASLLKDKVSLEVELKRLKDSLLPKEAQIKELKETSRRLSMELAETEEEKVILENRFKDSKEVASILSRDLLNEKEKDKKNQLDNEMLKAKISSLESDLAHKDSQIQKLSSLEDFKEKYTSLVSEREGLRSKIEELKENLLKKVKEFDKLKAAYESEIKASKVETYRTPSEVDLPPIVLSKKVAPEPSWKEVTGSDRIKGRVLTVNREHNFVVIDLGRKDGVSVGSIFYVYRNGVKVGSIEIIEMRERIAAADIKNVDRDCSIEVDDIVLSQ